MSRKSLGHLRFREMFLSITGGADGSFNVLQQGSQDRVTLAAIGGREGTSDLWVLAAGFGTVRLEAYPQDAMGVPSLPSTHATLASAIGSPQDFVWDGTWYWVLDNDDKIIYAIDTSFNRESSEDIDITARTNNPITIARSGRAVN